MKHVIVAQEKGMFCGWPANNGIWHWGNEILVGYKKGSYLAKTDDHSIDREQAQIRWLARSRDGGETWAQELPESYDLQESRVLEEAVNFSHPDFAMRCRGSRFWFSYDRGLNWQGSFPFPSFGIEESLSSRTDYIVNGSDDCHFFFSAKEPRVEAGLQDRSFCARTTDGGSSFEFLSWISADPIEVRSVMSSTVRTKDGDLVSALRRRRDYNQDGQTRKTCWIDVYGSKDDGESWSFLSKGADTDEPETGHNGNPPALVGLADGRLCLMYGYRSRPFGMRAKVSDDGGRTWGRETKLRDDARTWDIGYPKAVVRPDGQIFVAYYYTTEKDVVQHIAATIWHPNELS